MGRTFPVSVLIPAAATAALLSNIASPPTSCRADECATSVIETIAGGGVGDGGLATQASLRNPQSVAVAPDGTIYIADSRHGRIRKVDPRGIISTVGVTEEGRPAGELLYGGGQGGVAVGRDGSLYVVDGHYVLKVSPAGVITTIAGTAGQWGYSGDGGPATEARLRDPRGVAEGPEGSIYISDRGNQRVRKIDPAGIITTVAGDGWNDGGRFPKGRFAGDGGPATRASLNWPSGIAVGADGSVYIADLFNYRVRKVDAAGIITTVAGTGEDTHSYSGDGGPAALTSLPGPYDVAIGADGLLYMADVRVGILKVDAAGIITTVAPAGGEPHERDQAAASRLCYPQGISVAPDGSLYVAETNCDRVSRVALDGTIKLVAGGARSEGIPATLADLRYPKHVAVGPDGSVVTTDDSRTLKIRPGGDITTFAGTGAPGDRASIKSAISLAFGPQGDLYIGASDGRVRRIDAAGNVHAVAGGGQPAQGIGDGGPATKALIYDPSGLAFGPDGSLYIADKGKMRIRKVAPSGVITTVAGSGQPESSGDGGPALKAGLHKPCAVAVGRDGSIYIIEEGSQRVRRVDAKGVITTFAGNGKQGFFGNGGPATKASLNTPCGLAVGLDGSVYIADMFNQRIRRVAPTGIITTVVGSGGFDYLGDGGPAMKAGMNCPNGVAVGADGCLYIADGANGRIRRVHWRPCEPKAARAQAYALRAKAGESPDQWREVAELYLIAQSWDDALNAADRMRMLTAETNEAARMRAEVLAARAYAGKRDDHEARGRLIRILAIGDDAATLREAADALVNLYLMRNERDQAIATLNDLSLRTRSRELRHWIDERLSEFGGKEAASPATLTPDNHLAGLPDMGWRPEVMRLAER